MELSFGEQIKIILKRKNMTLQKLAEIYTTQTGLKMTRQNLSQRLKRDNFQEQDMHTLAALLGYQVSIQLTPLPENVHSSSIPMKPPTTDDSIVLKEPSPKKITSVDGSTFKIPQAFRKPQIQGDVNEDYFWEFQANKKQILGSDYQEPILI